MRILGLPGGTFVLTSQKLSKLALRALFKALEQSTYGCLSWAWLPMGGAKLSSRAGFLAARDLYGVSKCLDFREEGGCVPILFPCSWLGEVPLRLWVSAGIQEFLLALL